MTIRGAMRSWFDESLVRRLGLAAFDRHTVNTTSVRWLGHKLRQNPMDAWTIQELIVERDVDLDVECGTYEGGLALFVASLFDLLGRGSVITIDVEDRMTETHPRVERILASSTDPDVVARVHDRVARSGTHEVLVVLDSDHSADHVLAELEAYSDLVSVGGYVVVQDGVVDELARFKQYRPGPLVAIRQFVGRDDRFVVDRGRSAKFLFHYSPEGCLRRVR